MGIFSADYHDTVEHDIAWNHGYAQGIKDADNKWIKAKDEQPLFQFPVLVAFRISPKYGLYWDYDIAKYVQNGKECKWVTWRDGTEIKPVYWKKIITPEVEENAEE